MNRWTASDGGLRLQNLLLLGASYLFYAWWDWRFLSLIAFSTLVDYFVGGQSEHPTTRRKRKSGSAKSLGQAMAHRFPPHKPGTPGRLQVHKLLPGELGQCMVSDGHQNEATTWQIILPVGISFYTFQTLCYSIDIYRRKLEPTKDLIAFAAFVGFFPQLVAGPIEKASSLLPQLRKRRTFDERYAISGVKLFVWGWFKKAMVADN